MSVRTPPGADHLLAWAAMPWVLNGSASEAQRRSLAEHLAHCEDCRSEFEHQQRLQHAMSLPPPMPAVDAEAGLQRLLARIDAPQDQESPDRTPSGSRASRWTVRALAAAVVVQAVGLGVMSLQLRGSDDAAVYRTLSQPAAAPGAATLRVVPDAAMTLEGWNALLRSLQLQVVGGPNEMGAYALAPIASVPPATSTPPTTLDRLRAAPGIRLAEPIVAAP